MKSVNRPLATSIRKEHHSVCSDNPYIFKTQRYGIERGCGPFADPKALSIPGSNDEQQLEALFQLLTSKSFYQSLCQLLIPSPRHPSAGQSGRITSATSSPPPATAASSKHVTDAAALVLQRSVTVCSKSRETQSCRHGAFLHVLSIPRVWTRSVRFPEPLHCCRRCRFPLYRYARKDHISSLSCGAILELWFEGI